MGYFFGLYKGDVKIIDNLFRGVFYLIVLVFI